MAQSAFDGVIIPHKFPVVQYFCNISEILFYVIRLTVGNITVNKLYRNCKLFMRRRRGRLRPAQICTILDAEDDRKSDELLKNDRNRM